MVISRVWPVVVQYDCPIDKALMWYLVRYGGVPLRW